MPEPMDAKDYAGPHPTCREFVAQLAAWGFRNRQEEGVHTVFRGPRGGKLRVIRSQLGRADPALVDKAARMAGVTPAQFWAGPEEALAPPQDNPCPRRVARPRPAGRDSVTSLVLAVHAAVDRPLGFDQVVELSGGRGGPRTGERGQLSAVPGWPARADTVRRVSVVRGPARRRLAGPRAPPGSCPSSAAVGGPERGRARGRAVRAAFPSGVRLTAEVLADLEQWARLTGKLAAHGGAPGR